MKQRIIIFDTTLRDGEQAPGASLNIKQKLEVAHQLAKLNVDVIEAGFPVASSGDFKAVELIAEKIKGPIICGLARAIKKDIDAARKALKKAHRQRIHVFLATSKIHMKYKLKKAEDEILRQAVESVKYAKRFVSDIEFSPEDATRTDPEFLYKVLEAVIDAGATTVNIPDTVGYTIPNEYGQLIRGIKNNVRNIDQAVISVHCHDDLGQAVANSLEAVRCGARQIECTVNGIGERAGSASLEEVVMALSTRKDIFSNVETKIKKDQIFKTSRLVSAMTGFLVPPNKAIVGANAFRHESGIHVHGVLAKRATYEIMSPQEVGAGKTQIVLGKHSGRHAVCERLKQMGYTLNEKDTGKVFAAFKTLADKKKEVFDEDLAAILEVEIAKVSEKYKLESLHIVSGTDVKPTATIKLKYKGKIIGQSAVGDGPVDACYKAIDKISKMSARLEDYSLHGVTGGKEALGEVSVRLRIKNRVLNGRGASTDIIEASVKAYINALNKL
ncbi:MAG: 2-isopropylmalate synthase [Candidatus Omnitrophota bacterium]